MLDRICTNCVNCLVEDFGYSNYTVEGSYVHCMSGVHPESGFDRFYGQDDRNNFAKQCHEFESGNSECIDVDCEDIDRLSDRARKFINRGRF